MNIWEALAPKKGRGGAKLAWLKMLKNSARNCTLKLSEILLIGKFLYTEKSRLASEGPTMLLRPALPRRFAQVPGRLELKGTHCEAIAGVALGIEKQLALM